MNTTLDGWEALHMVVQFGSFAAAAEKLNRSQSTISYAISRLQDQLGMRLFELKGRRAQLTEAGRALLADAEPLLGGFSRLEQRARSLVSGGESEIRLSVDSLYPSDKLFAALAAFTEIYPWVHPTLRQGTFLSSATEFLTHDADLCITGLPASEYFVKPVLDIRMQAVARSDHPLHQRTGRLSRCDLLQHLAVIIEGIASGEPRRQPRIPSQRSLNVNTIEAAVDAVRSSLCFGWLPVYRVQPYIDTGELVPLELPVGGTRNARFHLVCRDLDSSNHAQTCLAELLGLSRELQVI
ncbi:MAG TPA: LysR family transcriptional regulator [Candidatus Acidoferrum sp.]|nr:LysR family transcriptional regulator [Candidatus Acidoferrum sp.]